MILNNMLRKTQIVSCYRQNITASLKNCYLNAHVAVTSRKHLRSSKRITNVNATCASYQKHLAKGLSGKSVYTDYRITFFVLYENIQFGSVVEVSAL